MNSTPGIRTDNRTPRHGVLVCDHCGDEIRGVPVRSDAAAAEGGSVFCCAGCRTVYELLHDNGLCEYYAIQPRSGVTPDRTHSYAFLDDDGVQDTLLDFKSQSLNTVTLTLPRIHCSSCIWLLEQLYRIDRGITYSRVDFLKKTVVIRYTPTETTLRRVVELLASLGYAPELETERHTLAGEHRNDEERSLYYRIGVAGFCFGNIMLLSFPEYLSLGDVERGLRTVFSYASLVLALPVVVFCASGYFLSAYRGLRRKAVTIDVPIALGIAVVFLRSLVDILLHLGPGYLDSLSGLVFFLLLGRLFQSKTYERMNFDRNYRSYFPIAVTVVRHGAETTVPLERVGVGDKILVRNNEIIPADAYVLNGEASIDYSFVTGESALTHKRIGELVYAGGRQSGAMIEVQIAREVSQSYLTQLWNADAYTAKRRSRSEETADAVGKYFTITVLALAALAGAYWLRIDPSRAMNAMTGVLIIACPCALALSTPFALGTAMRIFGRSRCYVKNTSVIESLASVEAVIFDKTGTLTSADASSVRFIGETLTALDRARIASVASQSSHPLSRMIASDLTHGALRDVGRYREVPGQGIEGSVDSVCIRMGSHAFATGGGVSESEPVAESRIYVALDGRLVGYFAVAAAYRPGIGAMLASLGRTHAVSLVSGDNDSERSALAGLYGKFASMHFFQSPMEKLRHVQLLQMRHRAVAMVGDGLNDAGALRQSNVGIAVTEQIGLFSPACDAILDAAQLDRLPALMAFACASVRIVHLSFAFSFLYNLVGLAFAVQGALSPVMAAVLMPLSSVSVAVFAVASTRLAARRRGL